MATFDSIFTPEAADATGTILTTASSAEIVIGPNRLFAITASDDIHIFFGNASMGAATASNFLLPGGSVTCYDTGQALSSIRLYNATGSTVTYYIQYLAR